MTTKQTVVDYEIVVPSRGRAAGLCHILDVLPSAIISVDEREKSEYSKHVPLKRLRLHPPTATLGEVRQLIIDYSKFECVVMIDDDFDFVVSMTGRKPRRIIDADAIIRIIENTINCAADIGVCLFSWSRMPNPLHYMSCDPLSFVALASNAWGVIGRKFKVDPTLNLCESVDLTMQNLLHNRIVLHDRRFYFDCGPIWAGAGGLQGIRTSAGELDEKTKMAQRWGRCLCLNKKKKGGTTGMSIAVKRKSAFATN